MKVRGRRECQDCGSEWSYYETGSVACPHCGSLRSVGLGERTRHTATPTRLDLSERRRALEDASLSAVVDGIKSDARTYIRRRGFVDAGTLLPLDGTFLAAHELAHAADVYGRLRDPVDDDRLYLLSLLRGADAGDRPTPEEVPVSMQTARGLAVAEAVDDYRREVSTWLDDNPDPAGRRVLGALANRVRRVQALEGDVAPEGAESLVRAAREVGTYLRDGDEGALARASDRLDDTGET
jgi:hypothetical protein